MKSPVNKRLLENYRIYIQKKFRVTKERGITVDTLATNKEFLNRFLQIEN